MSAGRSGQPSGREAASSPQELTGPLSAPSSPGAGLGSLLANAPVTRETATEPAPWRPLLGGPSEAPMTGMPCGVRGIDSRREVHQASWPHRLCSQCCPSSNPRERLRSGVCQARGPGQVRPAV